VLRAGAGADSGSVPVAQSGPDREDLASPTW